MRLLLPLFFLFLSCTNCATAKLPTYAVHSGVSGVYLTTDKREYIKGETATVSLVNQSQTDLCYAICHYGMELKEEDGWNDFKLYHKHDCPAVQTILKPGESTGLKAPIAHHHPSGSMRFRGGAGCTEATQIYSNPFTVKVPTK